MEVKNQRKLSSGMDDARSVHRWLASMMVLMMILNVFHVYLTGEHHSSSSIKVVTAKANSLNCLIRYSTIRDDGPIFKLSPGPSQWGGGSRELSYNGYLPTFAPRVRIKGLICQRVAPLFNRIGRQASFHLKEDRDLESKSCSEDFIQEDE
ncbi:hypothetical protein Syun_020839 [Stephania yunnanensis]|uniref:Uncharacterized protein n=1 Tax=Stephania yunnanensis TaxID=152371 RepID=A0AAP0IEY0_9MAGN